jgi:hypothetical protein
LATHSLLETPADSMGIIALNTTFRLQQISAIAHSHFPSPTSIPFKIVEHFARPSQPSCRVTPENPIWVECYSNCLAIAYSQPLLLAPAICARSQVMLNRLSICPGLSAAYRAKSHRPPKSLHVDYMWPTNPLPQRLQRMPC